MQFDLIVAANVDHATHRPDPDAGPHETVYCLPEGSWVLLEGTSGVSGLT